MAIYRNVQLSFWTDNKVEDDFTPEDKYFYIYLLTNPQTNICGCYEVSYSQMTRQTGYNKETIDRLFDRFENVHRVIRYSRDTKEILLINWYKYNWSKSEKTLVGVENVAKHIKSDDFRKYVFDVINCIRNNTPIMGHICPIQASVSDTDSVSDSITDTDNKDNNINIQKKETYKELLERLLLKYSISDYLLESVKDWLEYKIERNRFRYKAKGLNSLLNQVNESARKYGDEAVANAIRESIASSYQGIVWDKVSKGSQNRGSGGIDWDNV